MSPPPPPRPPAPPTQRGGAPARRERGGAGAVRCALALLSVALAATCACADKRAEMSPVPFVLGSRYGRSPPRMIAPRNDRFFMGSRYGKRSEADAGSPAAGGLGARGALAPPGGPAALRCEYTGLGALYRCRAAAARRVLTDDRRNEQEPSAPAEEQ